MHGEKLDQREQLDPQLTKEMFLQCVHCGTIATASQRSLVECPACGRVGLRLVYADTPAAGPTVPRRIMPLEDTDILGEMTSLVDRLLARS